MCYVNHELIFEQYLNNNYDYDYHKKVYAAIKIQKFWKEVLRMRANKTQILLNLSNSKKKKNNNSMINEISNANFNVKSALNLSEIKMNNEKKKKINSLLENNPLALSLLSEDRNKQFISTKNGINPINSDSIQKTLNSNINSNNKIKKVNVSTKRMNLNTINPVETKNEFRLLSSSMKNSNDEVIKKENEAENENENEKNKINIHFEKHNKIKNSSEYIDENHEKNNSLLLFQVFLRFSISILENDINEEIFDLIHQAEKENLKINENLEKNENNMEFYNIFQSLNSLVHSKILEKENLIGNFKTSIDQLKDEKINSKETGKLIYVEFKNTSDNSYYLGTVKAKDFVKHGIGIFIQNDNSKYVGRIIDGKFDGKGRFFSSNGDFFEGMWNNIIYFK